jgi:hypothetical protein
MATKSAPAPVVCPFATINIKLHVPMTLELKPSNFTKWSTAFQATCRKFGLLHHLATASTSNFDESWRLLTVDDLLEVAVKKGVLHVQLVNRPGAGRGDAEYRSARPARCGSSSESAMVRTMSSTYNSR